MFSEIPRPRTSELGVSPYRRHTVLPADPVGTGTATVPVIDLKQAQATDQVVRRVSDLIQRGQRPTTEERKRELSET